MELQSIQSALLSLDIGNTIIDLELLKLISKANQEICTY